MPLPAELKNDPKRLRRIDVRKYNYTDEQMYKLICVFCFRIGTSKPLLNNNYASLTLLKSNLTSQINGDKDLVQQFEKCWKKMVNCSAIITQKSPKVASLTTHPKEITDPLVKECVEWALAEQRISKNWSKH